MSSRLAQTPLHTGRLSGLIPTGAALAATHAPDPNPADTQAAVGLVPTEAAPGRYRQTCPLTHLPSLDVRRFAADAQRMVVTETAAVSSRRQAAVGQARRRAKGSGACLGRRGMALSRAQGSVLSRRQGIGAVQRITPKLAKKTVSNYSSRRIPAGRKTVKKASAVGQPLLSRRIYRGLRGTRFESITQSEVRSQVTHNATGSAGRGSNRAIQFPLYSADISTVDQTVICLKDRFDVKSTTHESGIRCLFARVPPHIPAGRWQL